MHIRSVTHFSNTVTYFVQCCVEFCVIASNNFYQLDQGINNGGFCCHNHTVKHACIKDLFFGALLQEYLYHDIHLLVSICFLFIRCNHTFSLQNRAGLVGTLVQGKKSEDKTIQVKQMHTTTKMLGLVRLNFVYFIRYKPRI